MKVDLCIYKFVLLLLFILLGEFCVQLIINTCIFTYLFLL